MKKIAIAISGILFSLFLFGAPQEKIQIVTIGIQGPAGPIGNTGNAGSSGTTNIGVNVVTDNYHFGVLINGNVTANKFYGDGGSLTGINAIGGITTLNADSRYLGIIATANASLISNTSNFAVIAGNAGITTINADVRYVSPNYNGNISANFFIGDGSLLRNVVGGLSTVNANLLYLGITATSNYALTTNYAVTAGALSFALPVYMTTTNADVRYYPIGGSIGILTTNADLRYLGINNTANYALTSNYAITANLATNYYGTIGILTINADTRYVSINQNTLAVIKVSTSNYSLTANYANNIAPLVGYVTSNYFGSVSINGTVSANNFYGNGGSLTGLSSSQVGLGNVQNTALSTWTGSTSITTLGTIGTGSWNGSSISWSKIDKTGSVASDVGALATGGTAADSSKLNGQSASYYLNGSNINSGTIGTQYLPTLGISTTNADLRYYSISGIIGITTVNADSRYVSFNQQTVATVTVTTANYAITANYATNVPSLVGYVTNNYNANVSINGNLYATTLYGNGANLSGIALNSYPTYVIYADQKIYPDDTDAVSTQAATLQVVSGSVLNRAVRARTYDDTVTQNCYYDVFIPEGATGISIDMVIRQKTTANASAQMFIQSRIITLNVGSWSAPMSFPMPTIAFVTPNGWFTSSTKNALANVGLTAGNSYQFAELRNTNVASDTVGDIYVYYTRIRFY